MQKFRRARNKANVGLEQAFAARQHKCRIHELYEYYECVRQKVPQISIAYKCMTMQLAHVHLSKLEGHSQSVSQAWTPYGRRYTLHTLHAHWQQKFKNVLKCCFQTSQFCAATSQ